MDRPTSDPYGPNTRSVRRFLQRFAALDADQWAAAATAFAALERTPRLAAADRALAAAITRADRVRERDAVVGPLLQITRAPTAPDASADAAAEPEPHAVAAPALAATLALVARDVLDEETFATLYAPFASLIWLDAL